MATVNRCELEGADVPSQIGTAEIRLFHGESLWRLDDVAIPNWLYSAGVLNGQEQKET